MKKFIRGTLWFLLGLAIITLLVAITRVVILFSGIDKHIAFAACGWFSHAAVSCIWRKRKEYVLVLKIKKGFPFVEEGWVKEKGPECLHTYGHSSLFDRLVEGEDDEQKCLDDKDQQLASTYPYEQFNYCPDCGEKIERE